MLFTWLRKILHRDTGSQKPLSVKKIWYKLIMCSALCTTYDQHCYISNIKFSLMQGTRCHSYFQESAEWFILLSFDRCMKTEEQADDTLDFEPETMHWSKSWNCFNLKLKEPQLPAPQRSTRLHLPVEFHQTKQIPTVLRLELLHR